MSSLIENVPKQSLKNMNVIDTQTCWEFLSCSKVLCPAHGRRGIDCWLISKTHCDNYLVSDFFEKLPQCLICPYFKARGNRDPKGWNYFVADQIQRYNVKTLKQTCQKEESFVEILSRIPDGLFTTGQDFRITYFNPAAEKITGFSASDAVGMYCKDVFKSAVCENDCALKRAVSDGKDIHNQEYVITNMEGEKVPIICSTTPFRDNSGRITGGIEIFKDLTEQRRLQAEISKREKKYHRIFEGSHDMIYITELAGKILDVNQAGVEMLGYRSKEELLGLGSIRQLYWRPRDRDRFLKLIKQEGSVKDFEVDFRKRDGTRIHVLISSRRYENPESGDIEFEGIIKDITHRKLTEEILKERTQELSILHSVAVALNLTMGLSHILKVTLKHVLKALRLKRGALFMIDREKRKARLQVRFGLPKEDPEHSDETIFKDTLLMKHLIEDGVALTPKPTFPSFQVSYRAKGGRPVPWLSCFLITLKGRGVGFFGLDIPSSRELTQHELHLLGSLGNLLGGAIENAQLMETIRLHREELRRVTGELFQSQEEELRRIARELHDEAGQALTAVKLGLDRLEEKVTSKEEHLREEIDEIRKMIVRTSSEIRGLSYRLHPTLLSDLGLEPALNLYFKQISSRSGLDIEFHMVGFDHRLDVDMETVLYRFSQEALTNTLKHSGAEHFRLSIIKSYPRIIFRAEDDGIGFDGQIGGSDKRNLGLLCMRERTFLLGGAFHLHSRPGEGTRIRIEIPLPEVQSHG